MSRIMPTRKMKFLVLCITGTFVEFLVLRAVTEFSLQFTVDDRNLCDTCLSPNNRLCSHPIKPPVEPLLSANHNLSEDDFKWWKRLQGERGDYNKYNQAVNRLLQIFPTTPRLTKPSSGGCKTCAVVGNSGNLKGSRNGPLIDFHDYVIRINRGHTEGYEEDVGTRTTHRVMYPESAVNLDNNTHFVLAPFKTRDIEWLTQAMMTGFHGKSNTALNPKIAFNKDLVTVINPAFIRYADDMWLRTKDRYPSTGFITVALALNICHEVHVFGFGADSDGNWSHYWEELKNKKLKTGGHPGQVEYDVIQQLDKEKNINFYRGW